ncbi:MAG TPA: hypothetical protein PLP21_18185 [Pyrinomonadaceae bacterium]|nr:hypothetical protein [Acidobacteriota bacterium]HQZ98254.1 hypothetical protein [Pyrinomonadaceae bacterium]
MKTAFVALLVLAINAFPQKSLEAIPVDEFGEVCSEDLMARMDNFLNQINNNPTARGVVIFHGRTDTEGRNQKLADYIARRPTRPGIELPRLPIIRGENRSKQFIQFWLVPAGAPEPKPDRPHLPNAYTETSLFDRSPVGFHRWEGVLDIYDDGFYDLGCNFSPNKDVFAEILNANRNVNAVLIVYTDAETRKDGLKLASWAINDLVKNHKVSRSRVRAIFGGLRKEAEIEFWLVPKGKPNPAARPNLDPIRSF